MNPGTDTKGGELTFAAKVTNGSNAQKRTCIRVKRTCVRKRSIRPALAICAEMVWGELI